MTASNTELTVKAKTEEAEKESFVIPLKAFDLIQTTCPMEKLRLQQVRIMVHISYQLGQQR